MHPIGGYDPERHFCPEPIAPGADCILIRVGAGPDGRDLVAPVAEPVTTTMGDI